MKRSASVTTLTKLAVVTDQIKDIKPLMTMVGGEIVYEAK